MNLANLLVNAAASAGGAGVIMAIIQGVFSIGNRRAEVAAKMVETKRMDAELWREESREAYERVEHQLEDCDKRLKKMSVAFYELLDDLNDIEGDDPVALRTEIREAARKARRAVLA